MLKQQFRLFYCLVRDFRLVCGAHSSGKAHLSILREEENIAGSFVENAAVKEMEETTGMKESMKKKSNEKTASSSKDIRAFFLIKRFVFVIVYMHLR